MNAGAGVGEGVGVGLGGGVGGSVGRALAVGVGLGDAEGHAGFPPQPAMAAARTNPANTRLVELLTPRLPLSSELLQDDASWERA